MCCSLATNVHRCAQSDYALSVQFVCLIKVKRTYFCIYYDSTFQRKEKECINIHTVKKKARNSFYILLAITWNVHISYLVPQRVSFREILKLYFNGSYIHQMPHEWIWYTVQFVRGKQGFFLPDWLLVIFLRLFCK